MPKTDEPTAVSKEAQFYIDCEFDGHNGVLLSMALVRDDGDGIHIRTRNFATDEWVKANVVPLLDAHAAPKSAYVSEYEVGGVIRAFIGDCERPLIIADSPVDIGRFCQALSTGPDGGWASADYPAMRFEVHNVDCYPTNLQGAVQHNAWWDAMALRHKLAHLRTPAGEAGEMVRPRDHWDADWWKPEPSDPFWMLEAEDGEWLKNRDSLLGTRDATKAIRFPTEETAMAHPARMKPGSKWWSAKATEHLWCDFPETATRLSATDTEAMRQGIADALDEYHEPMSLLNSHERGERLAARIDALAKGGA